MMTYLLLDMSNLLYRAFYANKNETDDIMLAMCHQSALFTMSYLYKKFKPDEIVPVFDSHSWRKEYSKYASISHKKYKGNRRQNLTDKEKEQLAVFDTHIKEFYEFLKNSSSLLVLKRDLLECDDLIAGFVDMHPDDKHIIISTDKDFIQLLNNPNVKLIEPIKETERTLSDWHNDHNFFMFEKCIRGDVSDNVQSSYPRLHKKKIESAYNDPFMLTNIMEHTFSVEAFDANGELKVHEYTTKDLFNENVILMDLRRQPQAIKTKINNTIIKAKKERGKFKVKDFLRLCSTFDLERILSNPKPFTEMLSVKPKDINSDLFG